MSTIRRQRCVGCLAVKEHTARYFYRCKTGKYGLRIKCKDCVRADMRETRVLKRECYREYERRRYPQRLIYKRAWVRTPSGRASRRLSGRIYRAFKAAELRA